MRDKILITIIAGITTILSMAENYPYRSDLLWTMQTGYTAQEKTQKSK